MHPTEPLRRLGGLGIISYDFILPPLLAKKKKKEKEKGKERRIKRQILVRRREDNRIQRAVLGKQSVPEFRAGRANIEVAPPYCKALAGNSFEQAGACDGRRPKDCSLWPGGSTCGLSALNMSFCQSTPYHACDAGSRLLGVWRMGRRNPPCSCDALST